MIYYQKDTDQIVTLILDMDGQLNNVINHEIGQVLNPVMDRLKQDKQQGTLRGVILTSAKKTFLTGGHLEQLYETTDPADVYAFTTNLKKVLRDLESPGVPVVAALNGSAMGLGFEVALACHHRVVIADPKIRLGLPEVSLGLIPGGGGIIRLMWLLGLEQAFHLLVSGRRYGPHEAHAKGLVDELALDEKDMMDKARRFLLENQEGCRIWDRPGEKIPGGNANDPSVAKKMRILAASTVAQTHYLYPAPHAILHILNEGSKVNFDVASRLESRYYTELVRSQTSKNMIKSLWFDYLYIKQGENRPKGYGRFRPQRIGVIGAGRMGSGIALACLRRGLKVILKDVSRPIAERGRQFIEDRLQEWVEESKLLNVEREEIMDNLTITDNAEDFTDCDLVLEAVFENDRIKQNVLREAEEHMDEYAFFGTNTVSIPITQLAKSSARPESYVGLHFFVPAETSPLVEIIRGDKTSEETIARAFDFVRRIKKTPIVVKDDWGFYAARVQNTYILEGIALLQEGYAASLIENLGIQAGMPRGPLTFADALGLPLVLRYEDQAASHYGDKYVQHPASTTLRQMIDELERPGRRKGKGFFDYEGFKSVDWPAMEEHFPVTIQEYDREVITERLLFAQVIEAFWCMQEGVIKSVAAANLGSIHGWGFPAAYGGVIQYVSSYGLDEFLSRCNTLQKQYGPRFRPPKSIRHVIEVQVPKELKKVWNE